MSGLITGASVLIFVAIFLALVIAFARGAGSQYWDHYCPRRPDSEMGIIRGESCPFCGEVER